MSTCYPMLLQIPVQGIRLRNCLSVAGGLGLLLIFSIPLSASTGEMLLAGCALLQRGEYHQAAARFGAAAQQDQFCQQALVGEGVAWLRLGEAQTALEYFRRARAISEDSALSLLALGAGRCQCADYRGARDAYQRLLDAGGADREEVAASLAYVDGALGLYDSAITQASRVVADNPDHPLARYALAASLFTRNRLTEAIAIVENHGSPSVPQSAATLVDCCLFAPQAYYAQTHEPPILIAAVPPAQPEPLEYLHQQPDFRIIHPQHMQTVSGQIRARLQADEAAGVEYVAVLLGGKFVGITNVVPLSMTIDTIMYPDGLQRLRVDGYGKDGRIVRKAAIGIVIRNGNRTLAPQEQAARQVADDFLRHQLRLRPRPGQWEHLQGRIWQAAGRRQQALNCYEAAFSCSPALPRLREHLLSLYRDMAIPVLGPPRELHQLAPEGKAIALTFDDGPHPKVTPWILDQLDRYGIKATFFLVGKQVDLYPELTRQILDRGHQLACHSYTHRNLKKCSQIEIERELVTTRAAIRRAAGVNVTLFRPPGGHYDEVVRAAAATWGFTTVFWTCNIGRFADRGPHRILTGMLGDIGPGGIVLLHNGEDPTTDILPSLLNRLTAQGMKMVALPSAANMPPPEGTSQ